jgi:hypothetical protein
MHSMPTDFVMGRKYGEWDGLRARCWRFVRAKYLELWNQGRRRYRTLWPNKWLTSEASTIDGMIKSPRAAALFQLSFSRSQYRVFPKNVLSNRPIRQTEQPYPRPEMTRVHHTTRAQKKRRMPMRASSTGELASGAVAWNSTFFSPGLFLKTAPCYPVRTGALPSPAARG